MRVIFGDTVLPSIIDLALEELPYAVVVHEENTKDYVLYLTASPAIYCENTIEGVVSHTMETTEKGFSVCYIDAGLGSEIWQNKSDEDTQPELQINVVLDAVTGEHNQLNIVWSNHDIKKATRTTSGSVPSITTETHFKDSSGVQCPPIPWDMIDVNEYPYVCMYHLNMLIMEAYILCVSKQPILHIPYEVLPEEYKAEAIETGKLGMTALDTGNLKTPAPDSMMATRPAGAKLVDATWVFEANEVEDASVLPVGTTEVSFTEGDTPIPVSYEVLYANYDIKSVASVNEDQTYVVGDEIYFPNSEAPKGGIKVIIKTEYLLSDHPRLKSLVDGMLTAERPYGHILGGEQDGEVSYIFTATPEPCQLRTNDKGNLEMYNTTVGYTKWIIVTPLGIMDWTKASEDSELVYSSTISYPYTLLWANHDVINSDTGEVALQECSTEPIVNETIITLPDIPTGYEQYSHSIVLHMVMPSQGIDMLALVCADEPIYFHAADLALDFEDNVGNAVMFGLDSEEGVDTWVLQDELSDLSLGLPVGSHDGATIELYWSNRDILYSGTSEIYFPSSEAPIDPEEPEEPDVPEEPEDEPVEVPEYGRVKRQTMVIYAEQTRRLTGLTESLTPDRIATILEDMEVLEDISEVLF